MTDHLQPARDSFLTAFRGASVNLNAVVPWTPSTSPSSSAHTVKAHADERSTEPTVLSKDERTLLLAKTLELLWRCESVLHVE